jgi:hypothetical protein
MLKRSQQSPTEEGGRRDPNHQTRFGALPNPLKG